MWEEKQLQFPERRIKMNRVFRVLASCVFAVIIAFGTLVGGAFAQTTPEPSEFSLIPTGGQLVKLSPQIQLDVGRGRPLYPTG